MREDGRNHSGNDEAEDESEGKEVIAVKFVDLFVHLDAINKLDVVGIELEGGQVEPLDLAEEVGDLLVEGGEKDGLEHVQVALLADSGQAETQANRVREFLALVHGCEHVVEVGHA